MRCRALVTRDTGSLSGQCYMKKGVKVVRWAPTPLTTQVIKGLCRIHKKRLEAGNLLALVSSK